MYRNDGCTKMVMNFLIKVYNKQHYRMYIHNKLPYAKSKITGINNEKVKLKFIKFLKLSLLQNINLYKGKIKYEKATIPNQKYRN